MKAEKLGIVEWGPITLDELGYVSRGRSRHRPRDAAHLYGGPYPFVQTGDVKHAGLYLTQYSQTYNEAGLKQSRMWPAGTLCITIAANIAETSILGIEACFPDSVIGFIPDKERADARFLKYLFDTTLQRRFKQFTQGAAQDNLSQAKLLSLKLLVPPLAEQTRIASILSAYDDLIANNRRRIQLLEQAARLLYKEWFVRLRFPGHQHVKVKDGVPEGWERKTIADVCETVGGGTPSTKVAEYWDGDVTWVVPSDVTKNDCLVLLDSERKITNKGLRESSAKIVPAETILMTSRASVGFFVLMDLEVCTNQGFINIIPHDEEMRIYLLFNLMSRVTEIRSNAKGTTYQEISKGRFRKMDIIIPSETLFSEFGKLAGDMIQQMRCLKRSTLQLTQARDLLLSRLMGREIAV